LASNCSLNNTHGSIFYYHIITILTGTGSTS